MIKQILISILLIIVLSSSVNCMEYYTDGELIWNDDAGSDYVTLSYNFPINKTIYYISNGYMEQTTKQHSYYSHAYCKHNEINIATMAVIDYTSYPESTRFDSYSTSLITYKKIGNFKLGYYSAGSYAASTGYMYHILYYSEGDSYFITGNISCVDKIQLYFLDNGNDYILINNDTYNYANDIYNYTVSEGEKYKIVFNNDTEYLFEVFTSNIYYDYDACSYITLNFKDNCNNLLRNIDFQYCNHGGNTYEDCIVCYFSNSSIGSYQILFDNPDSLEIWTYTFMGALYYNIENPEDISYAIKDPYISWNNNIFVKDYNNSLIIEDALVSFSQGCIIDESLYPIRNKYTNIDGYAIFDQCELDSANIIVTKLGYKPFSDYISSINLDALKSGQTTIVSLVPNTDELNESEYVSTNYKTYIYFKNNNSKIINQILDSDDYVDLYYYNNNSVGESMTLQFYKTNIYTGKTILLNWNIPYEEEGYKRILKSNYTQTNYGYYGYLYSNSINGWNKKKRLSVSNNTVEVINHYQNLTKKLWFVNKNDNHSIDYRNEIKIIAYAKSNYTFLHDITLKLYDNDVLIESIALDVFDFINSDIINYYEWNMGYNYIKNHNYTVEMYGYDDTLLKTDYVNTYDLRKNKLTIIVKDRSGNTLTNSYIFLEGYTSLTTGSNSYNSYENLNNGNYRYKASKSGYTSGGWNNINIQNTDNIVTYILSYDSESGSLKETKISDNDLQTMFVSLMTILFIFILLGGLTHVVK